MLGIVLLVDWITPPPTQEIEIPEGFEEFAHFKNFDCRAFATYPDSVHGFAVKAITVANVDTATNELYTWSYFSLTHRSGWSTEIHDQHYSSISDKEFKQLIKAGKTDTIVPLDYICEIAPCDYFSIADLSRFGQKFAFVDVSFKGYPSLIIEKHVDLDDPRYHGTGYQHGYKKYEVYGFASGTVKLVDFEPYNQFKNMRSESVLGEDGTYIDYKNKVIIVPTMAANSCSDFGAFVNLHYKLEETTQQFVLSADTTQRYDFCE